MLKCPHKGSPEWIKLVDGIGELGAYKVFLANNEEVPEMSVIDSIIDSQPKIEYQPEFDVKELRKEFKVINSKYDTYEEARARVAGINKYLNEHRPDAPYKAKTGYAADGKTDIVTFVSKPLFQRVDTTTEIDHEKVAKLMDILTKLYPKINLKYTTKDIVTPEGNLARGSYQAGNVLIHSLLQNTDTLPHEYAHDYINMYESSPIVQQGIKLFGDKEKLVDAIGKQTVKALDWYNRFYNWIKGLFQTKQLTLNELVNSFMSAKEIGQKTAFNDVTEYQKMSNEEAAKVFGDDMYTEPNKLNAEMAKEATSAERVLQKAVSNIDFKINHIKRKGDLGRHEKAFLIEKNKELNRANVERALLIAAIEGGKSINMYYAQYQEAVENNSFGIKQLNMWKSMLDGYDWIDDLQDIINNKNIKDLSDDFKNGDVMTSLYDIINKRNEMLNAYETTGRKLLATYLSKYLHVAEAQTREDKEREYRKLPKEVRDRIDLKDYIEYYLENNEEFIKAKNEQILLQELDVASKDVGKLIRFLDNILDSPDIVLGATGVALSNMKTETDLMSFKFRDELLGILEDFEKQVKLNPTSSMRDVYSFMLEKDKDGNETGHRVDKYTSDMFKDLYAAIKTIREDVLLTDEQQAKAIHDVKESIAPRNEQAYNEARHAFINELLFQREIEQKEYDAITFDERKGIRSLLSDHLISYLTARKIENWENEYDYVFREPIDKYKSKQFEDLKKSEGTKSDDVNEWVGNTPQTKLYKHIVLAGKEADKMVPYNKRLKTRLPGMKAASLEKLRDGQKLTSLFTENFTRVFTPQPDELSQNDEAKKNPDKAKGKDILVDSKGNKHLFVPVRFTADFDAKDRSYDIPTLYMGYMSSAIRHNNIQKILPELEMIKYFMANRRIAETDKKGNVLLKKTNNDDNIRNDKRVFKSNESNNVLEQFNDFLGMVIYEDYQDATKLDKILSVLGQFTAFRVLAGNVMNGIGNVMTGETMQKIEAMAGEIIDPTNLKNATLAYWKDSPNFLLDIGKRKPNSLTNLLSERFDVLNEDTMTDFSKSTRIQQLYSSNSLFLMMHMGEHFMQNRFMMAMLDKKQAYDKDGKLLGSMLKQYRVENGELRLNDLVDLQKSKWTEEYQNRFKGKLKAQLRKMHGAYNELEKVAIQKYAVGRLAYQFRKFIVPNFRRRWAGKYYNAQMEDFVEGNYITFGRFLKMIALDVKALEFIAAGKKIKQGLFNKSEGELLDKEVANIRRTAAEISALMGTLMVLWFILPALMHDDDDDEKRKMKAQEAIQFYLLNSGKYAFSRYQSELTMFINPLEAFKLLKSPAAGYSIVQDLVKTFAQVTSPTEKYVRGPFKGENKLYHRFLDMFPILRQWFKMQDIQSQTSLMQQYQLFHHNKTVK